MAYLMLVDLYSQREQVQEHVRGWTPTDILFWLRRFGVVEEIPDAGDETLYQFVSNYT